ncbi:hypothetical protein EAF00_007986 [Botryotinia globosa]|nr:hypothetical protein EAF00_007986 [Botryotinia globosa]
MSGNRSSERRPRDSSRAPSSRPSRGSGRSHQDPQRQSHQQASSYHHAVGTSQQQSSPETAPQLSANETEFNNYMANVERNVPDNYNSTRNAQWGPSYPYTGMPVLSRATPPGSEPVALNVGGSPSYCEVCRTMPPLESTETLAQWKYEHVANTLECRLRMASALADTPVVTQTQGEYLHGQAFVDNNNYGQMLPPAPIPTNPSMPPPAAQNTYANTQNLPQQPQQPQQQQYTQQPPMIQPVLSQSSYDILDDEYENEQQQYTQQPPTIQTPFSQSSYDILDDEYENEQLEIAAAANETASGPGWGIEPSVIVPRSAYSRSESRGHRGPTRRHRR